MLLPAAPPPDLALAQRLAPVLVLDARERDWPTAVGDATVRVPGAPPGRSPTAYARVTADRVQYWYFAPDNPHDRGIVRTGRHEGDWELVQVELRAGRPVTVAASQHAVTEACGWGAVRRRDGHPVVYVAHGSHAGYFRPGTRDRTFPDPNDEATGDGRVVRPRVVLVDAREPTWMRWPGRWGATRKGLVPGESDSPRGPAFQGARWDDPASVVEAAGPCGAAAARPNRAEPLLAGGAAAAAILALLGLRRRFARRSGRAAREQ